MAMCNTAQRRLLKAGFEEARRITRKYATSFYYASRFLPKEKKYAAYSVYGICRLSDEAVDKENRHSEASIKKIQQGIDLAYGGSDLSDGLLLALRNTVNTYAIPKEYFEELIAGMHMDLNKRRYQNFEELYDYCYKVAGVVGLIIIYLFGYDGPFVRNHAVELGVAMQLTNIIRDVKEDFKRGRIYLPQDEMKRFGLSESDIAGQNNNENFKSLLKMQIARARDYYLRSEEGLNGINDRRCRFVVRVMKELYSAILTAVERNDYDVFSKRAHTNTLGKMLILLGMLAKR